MGGMEGLGNLGGAGGDGPDEIDSDDDDEDDLPDLEPSSWNSNIRENESKYWFNINTTKKKYTVISNKVRFNRWSRCKYDYSAQFRWLLYHDFKSSF